MSDPILEFKNECGCSTGKKVTIAGIILYIGFSVYFKTYTTYSLLINILILLYFIFSFAVIGKAIGLVAAYFRFRKDLRNAQKITYKIHS